MSVVSARRAGDGHGDAGGSGAPPGGRLRAPARHRQQPGGSTAGRAGRAGRGARTPADGAGGRTGARHGAGETADWGEGAVTPIPTPRSHPHPHPSPLPHPHPLLTPTSTALLAHPVVM